MKRVTVTNHNGDVVATLDTHLHLWDLERSPYSWLSGAPKAIATSMTFERVEHEIDAVGVSAAILVQADDTFADTDYMLECAERFDTIAGVVAFLPLDDPEECERTLARYAGTRRIVGVRSLTHDRTDADYLLRDEVDESLGLLESAGLPLDILAVKDRHLEVLPQVGEAHPSLRMVIDHLGTPPLAEDPRGSAWWELIARAATNPKMRAKVSGLYAGDGVASDPTSAAARLHLAFDRALEVFGSDRLMIGSDWPISEASGGYSTTMAMLRSLTEHLSSEERSAIEYRTGATHYGLSTERFDPAGR